MIKVLYIIINIFIHFITVKMFLYEVLFPFLNIIISDNINNKKGHQSPIRTNHFFLKKLIEQGYNWYCEILIKLYTNILYNE